MLALLLLIAAFVLILISAFPVRSRVSLLSIGLALFVLVFILDRAGIAA